MRTLKTVVFLVVLLLTFSACSGSVSVSSVPSDKDQEVEKTVGEFVAYGYIRSVWTLDHKIGSITNYRHMVVAFEGDDHRLFQITFFSLEPVLWQGLHAKIRYKLSGKNEPNAYVSNKVGYCVSYGTDLYDLISVERIR
jgi:hypothetical protein